MDLVLEEHDGEWFFGGHQLVKVGTYLWLYFTNINLDYVQIQSIEDIE
jgi:hypothetical protein